MGLYLHGGHGAHAASDNLLAVLPIVIVLALVLGARVRAWLRGHAPAADVTAERHGDEPI